MKRAIPTGQNDQLPAWLKKHVRARDNGLCQQCLRDRVTRVGTEIDHIIPRAHGGTHEPENLQLLCTDCHYHKTQAQLGNLPRGSCAHGIPYKRGLRCKKCPPFHKYWRRVELILGGTTPLELPPLIKFDGPIADYEVSTRVHARRHRRIARTNN